jgi:hypothetical protein
MQFGVRPAAIDLEMKIPGDLRVLVLGLAATTALPGQLDARETICNAGAANERNWTIARTYGFGDGWNSVGWTSRKRAKSSGVQTYFTLQDGTLYRQLVQRSDWAIRPAESRDARSAGLNPFAEAASP